MVVQEEFESFGERFNHSITEGNIEGVMALFMKDAVLLSSGDSIAQGHSEIEALIASWMKSYPSREAYTTLACQQDGEIGWWAGRYTADRKIGDDSTNVSKGIFLEVLRRQDDGSWKIQAVCVYPE